MCSAYTFCEAAKVELNEALGLVIKEIRQQRELLQEGLGPSQSYISATERGKWQQSFRFIPLPCSSWPI